MNSGHLEKMALLRVLNDLHLIFECKGMGDPSKMLRLREMIRETKPPIVLLQETLCDRYKAIKTVLSIEFFDVVACLNSYCT